MITNTAVLLAILLVMFLVASFGSGFLMLKWGYPLPTRLANLEDLRLLLFKLVLFSLIVIIQVIVLYLIGVDVLGIGPERP